MRLTLRFSSVIPLAVLLLCACYTETQLAYEETPVGYRPVYVSTQESEIGYTASRTVKNPGRIYKWDKYLLVNEKGKGIHVFDNTNPAEPSAQGFINIPGNTDMAIRNGVLYADYFGNVVSIQLNAFSNLAVTGKLPLTNWNQGVPPPKGFSFECVDPSKGLVVDWVRTENKKYDCYAIR